MKRKILVNSQQEVDEIVTTLEPTKHLFKLETVSPKDSPESNEVDIEFEDRYFQFLVDKIESLGYSKKQLEEL
jgi:hypothetical protein